MRNDPYVWYDAFDQMDQFDDWARGQEDRHRIEMAAVSRASWEGAMQVRSAYEDQLRRLTPDLMTIRPPVILQGR